MHGQKNNLLAGLLVVVSILAIVAAVIMLGGGLEHLGKSDYRVRFTLEEGAGGLKPGAIVRVGGVECGTVKRVVFEKGPAGEITGVIVTVSVESDIPLRADAEPYLETPLLGSLGSINFPVLGDGPTLKAGDILDGRIAPPALLAQAGYGDEEKAKVQNIIDRFSEIGDKFSMAGDKTNTVLDDTRVITSDFGTKWPEWRGRVDSISENFDETMKRGPEIAKGIEGRLDTIRAMLEENRETVKGGIANFESGTERFDGVMAKVQDEYLAIADEMFANANHAVSEINERVTEVGRLLIEQRPGIRRTFANLRLASDQLRDTLVEVRRSPWRLIYRPDLRELDYELLYASARHYASSVEELRATSEALEAATQAAGSDAQGLRRGDVESLLGELERSFEQFRTAQSAFMEQLGARSPQSP